jgi:hypothetical protein
MYKPISLLMLILFIISGCSSIKVVPDTLAAGIVNQQNNTITLSRDNVVITAGCSEPDMINYNVEGMVSSFNIEIQNLGESAIAFDNDSFLLIDSENRQYFALTPDKVRQMMAKDTYYLLPYPYIGFYYLEDYERASFKNSTNSNLPYYYEIYPQEIYSRSLPAGAIIPKAKISGLVYFQAEILSLKSFRLVVYKKGTLKSAEPDFSFLFRVLK